MAKKVEEIDVYKRQAKKLKDCFPMIRKENELLAEIRESETLRRTFQGWPEEKQRIFLDCCTGARGVKMLYDCLLYTSRCV